MLEGEIPRSEQAALDPVEEISDPLGPREPGIDDAGPRGRSERRPGLGKCPRHPGRPRAGKGLNRLCLHLGVDLWHKPSGEQRDGIFARLPSAGEEPRGGQADLRLLRSIGGHAPGALELAIEPGECLRRNVHPPRVETDPLHVGKERIEAACAGCLRRCKRPVEERRDGGWPPQADGHAEDRLAVDRGHLRRGRSDGSREDLSVRQRRRHHRRAKERIGVVANGDCGKGRARFPFGPFAAEDRHLKADLRIRVGGKRADLAAHFRRPAFARKRHRHFANSAVPVGERRKGEICRELVHPHERRDRLHP